MLELIIALATWCDQSFHILPVKFPTQQGRHDQTDSHGDKHGQLPPVLLSPRHGEPEKKSSSLSALLRSKTPHGRTCTNQQNMSLDDQLNA